MRQQLLLLLELQTIDTRVLELRAAMAALPEKIAPAVRDLAKLEALLQAEKDQLAETEKWRREQELTVQVEDEAIKKAKQKQQASKSSKDYAAASRELENKKKSKSDREDEILKVMEALEKSRAEIAAHESDVAALREHVAAENERIAVEVARLEAEARSAAEGREEIAGQVESRLLKRYQRVIEFKGVAVVPVIDGTCQGCHMSLPPQLSNVLARFDSIESCPRCTRIVYREEMLEPPAEDAAPTDDAASAEAAPADG